MPPDGSDASGMPTPPDEEPGAPDEPGAPAPTHETANDAPDDAPYDAADDADEPPPPEAP
ncbi:hypothetical protein [Streptomyces nigrescens]